MRFLAPAHPAKFRQWLVALPLGTLRVEYAISVETDLSCNASAEGESVDGNSLSSPVGEAAIVSTGHAPGERPSKPGRALVIVGHTACVELRRGEEVAA